jgi:hypothetical protein
MIVHNKLFKVNCLLKELVDWLPLEDYLIPNENIRFQSDFNVQYGDKYYTVILTDVRLILYARRGLIFKGDDVITESIREVQGIKYKETGMFVKTAHLIVQGRTVIDLIGNQASIKALYQRLLPFLSPEFRQPQPAMYMPQIPPVYQSPVQQSAHITSKFCANCGIEISPNSKFCNNCGKPV